MAISTMTATTITMTTTTKLLCSPITQGQRFKQINRSGRFKALSIKLMTGHDWCSCLYLVLHFFCLIFLCFFFYTICVGYVFDLLCQLMLGCCLQKMSHKRVCSSYNILKYICTRIHMLSHIYTHMFSGI